LADEGVIRPIVRLFPCRSLSSMIRMRSFALLGLVVVAVVAGPSCSQAQVDVVRTADDLLVLDEAQLLALYSAPTSTAVSPSGRIRGVPIVAPGTARNRVLSRSGRLVWQGKLMDPSAGTAVNRFFGVPSIRGTLSTGTSWIDGRPTVVLDYQDTSVIFARYRDEFRQVAPGVYLGFMFDTTTNPPQRTRTFVLDDH
jgi:hypothetical protein